MFNLFILLYRNFKVQHKTVILDSQHLISENPASSIVLIN